MNKPAFSIVTDGTKKGTLVLDQNGEPIEGVTSFSFSMDGEGLPEVQITLAAGALQAVSHETMVIVNCPGCGESIAHDCKDRGF